VVLAGVDRYDQPTLGLHERGRDQQAVELLDALVLRHWRTSDGRSDEVLDVARDLRP
jgi:hypothetical protein